MTCKRDMNAFVCYVWITYANLLCVCEQKERKKKKETNFNEQLACWTRSVCGAMNVSKNQLWFVDNFMLYVWKIYSTTTYPVYGDTDTVCKPQLWSCECIQPVNDHLFIVAVWLIPIPITFVTSDFFCACRLSYCWFHQLYLQATGTRISQLIFEQDWTLSTWFALSLPIAFSIGELRLIHGVLLILVQLN